MEPTSVKPVAVKYGAIYGVVSFLYFILLVMLDMSNNGLLSTLGYGIFIAFIVFAIREYKSYNEGYMKFKKGVGLGVLMALVSSLISSVFTFAYISFIDQNFIERQMEFQRNELLKNPQMTPETVDQAMSMTESFMSPLSISLFGIFAGVIGGLILSLIVSAIMKKDPPEDDLDFA